MQPDRDFLAPSDGASGFKPAAGAVEAFALSLSIIAPTLAMSFSTPLAAQAAGRAVPLAYALGGAIMIPVAMVFLAFAHRIKDAGSAHAYVRVALGSRAGFLAGWTMLLCYLAFAAGAMALVGTFASAALSHSDLLRPAWWVWAAAATVLVSVLARRRVVTLTRLMMVLEGIAMLAVLGLAAVIVTQVPRSSAPFVPQPGLGLPGVGGALVFAVLSFAGFEGATTLSEETQRPGRAIPLALVGALVTATAFYVVVSYAEVLGYGVSHAHDLASAATPLDALSTRYLSSAYGVFLDLSAAVGAFSFALAATSAAGRLLCSLGRASLPSRLAVVRPQDGLPAAAIGTACVVEATLVLVAGLLGGQDCSGALLTIGTLALILVYMAASLSYSVDAGRTRRAVPCAVGAAAILCLSWPLFASVYPVPDWPAGLWPCAVMAWIAAGGFLVLRGSSDAGSSGTVLRCSSKIIKSWRLGCHGRIE